MTTFINFPVFFFESHAPLTCVWSETGDPRQPLACRWVAQPQQPGNRRSAAANPAQQRRLRREREATDSSVKACGSTEKSICLKTNVILAPWSLPGIPRRCVEWSQNPEDSENGAASALQRQRGFASRALQNLLLFSNQTHAILSL